MIFEKSTVQLPHLNSQRQIELRRAQPGEAGALSQLAFAAKASHGYSHQLMTEWKPDLTVSAEYLQSNITWTVLLQGKLAGWGGLVSWGKRCRLEHLWIVPAAQRQGLGRILLTRLATEARIAGWREMEIISDPLAAGFYKRCGARPAGVETQPDGRRLPKLALSLATF